MDQGQTASGAPAQNGPAQPDPAGQPPAANGAHPAANGPIRRTVRVVNPLGLHHRVADLFSRTAKTFAAAVTVWNADIRADGKNIWDLLGLLAFEGTDVLLEVDGPDAAAAVEPLAGILAAPGGEDYTI